MGILQNEWRGNDFYIPPWNVSNQPEPPVVIQPQQPPVGNEIPGILNSASGRQSGILAQSPSYAGAGEGSGSLSPGLGFSPGFSGFGPAPGQGIMSGLSNYGTIGGVVSKGLSLAGVPGAGPIGMGLGAITAAIDTANAQATAQALANEYGATLAPNVTGDITLAGIMQGTPVVSSVVNGLNMAAQVANAITPFSFDAPFSTPNSIVQGLYTSMNPISAVPVSMQQAQQAAQQPTSLFSVAPISQNNQDNNVTYGETYGPNAPANAIATREGFLTQFNAPQFGPVTQGNYNNIMNAYNAMMTAFNSRGINDPALDQNPATAFDPTADYGQFGDPGFGDPGPGAALGDVGLGTGVASGGLGFGAEAGGMGYGGLGPGGGGIDGE